MHACRHQSYDHINAATKLHPGTNAAPPRLGMGRARSAAGRHRGRRDGGNRPDRRHQPTGGNTDCRRRDRAVSGISVTPAPGWTVGNQGPGWVTLHNALSTAEMEIKVEPSNGTDPVNALQGEHQSLEQRVDDRSDQRQRLERAHRDTAAERKLSAASHRRLQR